MQFHFVFTLPEGFQHPVSFPASSEKEAREVAKQLAKDLDALRVQFMGEEKA